MCDPKIYEGITPEVFETLRQKAAVYGLTLSGDEGATELHGCKFTWNYYKDVNQLKIQCSHTRWPADCEHVSRKLDELMTL